MSFEETNFDDNVPDDGQLPEESNNNRTFLIAAGILGGIILISVACLGVVFLLNRNNTSQAEAQAVSASQTAQAGLSVIDSALTATANAAIQPTATLPPSATAVVNLATATQTLDPNATPDGTSMAGGSTPAAGTPAAATATVGAALTQAAIAQLTIVPTTTALPNTGFVDDVGIPGLVVMALTFIIVILMARRLRFVPTR
jgi:arginine exporter protein ArgO